MTALLADGAELSEPTRCRLPDGLAPTGLTVRIAVRDGIHLVRWIGC